MREIICPVCGITFVVGDGRTGGNRKYCSEGCWRLAGRSRSGCDVDRHKAKKRKQRIEEAEQEENSITSICLKAKAAGMSYGEYVSKFNIR